MKHFGLFITIITCSLFNNATAGQLCQNQMAAELFGISVPIEQLDLTGKDKHRSLLFAYQLAWNVIQSEIITINVDALVPSKVIGKFSSDRSDWCVGNTVKIDDHILSHKSHQADDNYFFRWTGQKSGQGYANAHLRVDWQGKVTGNIDLPGQFIYIEPISGNRHLMIRVASK